MQMSGLIVGLFIASSVMGQDAAIEESLQKTKAELLQADDRMQHFRRKLQDDVGMSSPEAILQTIDSMQGELLKMKIEIAGTEARKKAIEEVIAQAQVEGEKLLSQDETLQQLVQLVKLHEARLAQVRQRVQNGIASNDEIRQLELQLIEARVKMLERRDLVRQTRGGLEAAKLGEQLVNISVNLAEMRARSEMIARTLNQLNGAGSMLFNFRSMQKRSDTLSEMVGEIERSLMQSRFSNELNKSQKRNGNPDNGKAPEGAKPGISKPGDEKPSIEIKPAPAQCAPARS